MKRKLLSILALLLMAVQGIWAEDYNITLPSVENGTVTAEVGGSSVTSAAAGETVSLVATPDAGYGLKSISGTAIQSVSETFSIGDFSNGDNTKNKTYFTVKGFRVSSFGLRVGVVTGTARTLTISSRSGQNLSEVVLTVTNTSNARNASQLKVDHGSVSATGKTEGSKVTITGINSTSVTLSAPSTTNASQCWHFNQVKVTGLGSAAVTLTATGDDNVKTFTMPSGDVTISAAFEAVPDVTQAEIDQEAADAVIAQINNLGTVTYTTACKDKIDAAKSAYNALTADQKALVSNYATLTAAETAYNNLKTQVDAAVAKIDAIGTVVYTAECKEKIDAARAAYDALTDEQKAAVNNYSVLQDADYAYSTLEEDVTVTISQINEIGTVTYTADCNRKIQFARESYDALNDLQKAAVTNYSTLTAAETTYNDMKAAADVVAMFDAIGEVKYTDECKAQLDAAIAAYTALTTVQQGYISNADKMRGLNMYQAYNNLKTQVDAFNTAVDAIGEVAYTDDCKQKIEAAETAYA